MKHWNGVLNNHTNEWCWKQPKHRHNGVDNTVITDQMIDAEIERSRNGK